MIQIEFLSFNGIYSYRQKSNIDLYNLCEMFTYLTQIDFSIFVFNGKQIHKGDTPLSVGMPKGVINSVNIF